MISRLLTLCLVAALAACAPAPGTERLSAGRTVDIASAATQISVQRAGTGILRPVIHSPALQGAAQSHADDLARSGAISHVGSDGSTLQGRLQRAGYTACVSVENIARGTSDIRTTIAEWMASDGHRANLLNAAVTQFGFARSTDNVWVLVMARPC
ncbi:MAG: CAP domain-containing protein [Roseicyclus sp.]